MSTFTAIGAALFFDVVGAGAPLGEAEVVMLVGFVVGVLVVVGVGEVAVVLAAVSAGVDVEVGVGDGTRAGVGVGAGVAAGMEEGEGEGVAEGAEEVEEVEEEGVGVGALRSRRDLVFVSSSAAGLLPGSNLSECSKSVISIRISSEGEETRGE